MGVAPSQPAASSSSSCMGHGQAIPVVKSSTTTSGDNQAQSKRAPPPHKFHDIVAGEKTSAASELEDQVYTGIFLAGKTKKYWVDEKTRYSCFMLFPRSMSITWSEDPRFWVWTPLKETSDAEIEAVLLKQVCWLEVHGRLELSHLTPGVTYELVFVVMLHEQAYGWPVPVNLRLKLPDGTVQQRKELLQNKPREQWLELKAGELTTQEGQKGEAEISLFEYEGGSWKSGLIIKGIKIIPKE